MMTDPKVTILICSFNGQDTIAAAVESALAQECDFPFELVVVDDGSTDGTRKIVGGMMDNMEDSRHQQFSLTGFDSNTGLANACNEGIKHAKGEYILRIDDDDLLLPDAIAYLLGAINIHSIEWSFGDKIEVGVSTGKHRHDCPLPMFGPYKLSSLPACGVMMQRDIILGVGGHRDIFWEEHDLHLRYWLEVKSQASYAPEPIFIHTARPNITTPAMRGGWCEMIDLWGEDTLRAHGFGEMIEEATK